MLCDKQINNCIKIIHFLKNAINFPPSLLQKAFYFMFFFIRELCLGRANSTLYVMALSSLWPPQNVSELHSKKFVCPLKLCTFLSCLCQTFLCNKKRTIQIIIMRMNNRTINQTATTKENFHTECPFHLYPLAS